MSHEPTISSSNVLSLFHSKILADIDISRTELSNVNKTDIVNSLDELVKLVKQNVGVNEKTNSGYDSFFPYSDNLVSRIPQMELASNSVTPIITLEEPNSVTSNLKNSPVTPNVTLTGSNKNVNIETLSPCNRRSAYLNTLNSSTNNILKVEARLSALTHYSTVLLICTP